MTEVQDVRLYAFLTSVKERVRTMGSTGFELDSLHNVDHQSTDTCRPLRTN